MNRRFFSFRSFFLLLFLIAAGWFSVWGENGISEKIETDEIRVVAESQTDSPQKGEAAPVDTIPVEGDTFETIGEILERKSGIHMRRYGGAGSSSTISVRGSDPDQVKVYLDQIPLNTGYRGEVDLAEYETTGLSRINLFRSSGSGSSAIGGTVQMETAPRQDFTKISAGGGSFGTGKISAGIARTQSDSSWHASGSAETSAQDFIYKNDNGTPNLNNRDDYDAKRKNSDYRKATLRSGGGYRIGKTDLRFLGDFFRSENGVPGSVPVESRETRLHLKRGLTGISSDTKGPFWDRLRIKTSAFGSDERREFHDPQEEFSTGLPDSRSRDRRYGFTLNPILYFPEVFQEIGATISTESEEYRRDKRDTNFVYAGDDTDAKRNTKGIKIQDSISLVNDHILIKIGGEYEEIADRGKSDDARTLYEAITKETETKFYRQDWNIYSRFIFLDVTGFQAWVHGGGGEGTRIPHFFEIFGDPGSIRANPDLQPESSLNQEAGAGMEVRLGEMKGSAKATLFDRRIENMILFVPGSLFTLRAENVDRARIRGIETELGLDLGKTIGGTISYTLQRSINESEIDYLKGNYLPLRPMHEAHLNLYWNPERWHFQFDSHYVGALFQSATNDYFSYRAPTLLHNVSLSYDLLSRKEQHVQIQLSVKNLMDKRVEDVDGYPLPNRSYYLSLSTEL